MTVLDLKSGQKEPWHKLQLALYVYGKVDPRIRFLEEGHRYFCEDRELVSVTRVLDPEPNPFYAKGSGARGNMVHRMCVMEAQGVLDAGSVVSGLEPWLVAWLRFRKEMQVQFLGFEEIIGNCEIGYAGRRDFYAEMASHCPGVILYLKKNGKYSLEPFTALEMNGLITTALKKVIEYNGKRWRMWP
jgi:hypothetical protein